MGRMKERAITMGIDYSKPDPTVTHIAIIRGHGGRWGGLVVMCGCGKMLAYDRGEDRELRPFIEGASGGGIQSVSQSEIDNLMQSHRESEEA